MTITPPLCVRFWRDSLIWVFFFHKFKHSAVIVFFFVEDGVIKKETFCVNQKIDTWNQCFSKSVHFYDFFSSKYKQTVFFLLPDDNGFKNKTKWSGIILKYAACNESSQKLFIFFWWDKNECAHSTQNTVFSPNPQNEAWILEQPLIDLFFFLFCSFLGISALKSLSNFQVMCVC